MFFIYNNAIYSVSLSLHKQHNYADPILFVPVPFAATQKVEQTDTATTTAKPPQPKKNNNTQINSTTIAAEKKVVQPPKPAEVPKPTPPTQKVATPPIKKESPQPQKTVPPTATPTQSAQHLNRTIPDNAITSDNYKEVEALRRNALLQKELVNNWKPPVGTALGTSCELSFYVDNQGNIKKPTVAKSSGIMMYDISARQALFSMKMPQWTHGKTITITFTQ